MMRSPICVAIHDTIAVVPSEKTERIIRLLALMHEGDRNAGEDLLKLVIADLRKLAASYMRSERPAHTLQPTALVNELWAKMFGNSVQRFENKGHFFAVCARAMRQILIDYARSDGAVKRGGSSLPVPLDELDKSAGRAVTLDVVFDIHTALQELGKFAPENEDLLTLKYFGGLTLEEIAEATHQSRASVVIKLRSALAWLRKRFETT
jgi:RNA polymerase sigma-70 factor (ECF subfamily)